MWVGYVWVRWGRGVTVDKLPNFECYPSSPDGRPGPQHMGTCHFENMMEEIENAYRESSMGMPASRPVIELTIPSALDTTIAPPGKHVVQLFVQVQEDWPCMVLSMMVLNVMPCFVWACVGWGERVTWLAVRPVRGGPQNRSLG
jgi:hypothetical protein